MSFSDNACFRLIFPVSKICQTVPLSVGVGDARMQAQLRSSSCQILPISYLPPVTQSLQDASEENLHLLHAPLFFLSRRFLFCRNFIMEPSNSTQIPFNRRVPISDTNIWIFLLIIRSRFERCWQGPNKASNGRPPKFLNLNRTLIWKFRPIWVLLLSVTRHLHSLFLFPWG